MEPIYHPRDKHSFSNIDEVCCNNLNIQLNVNFSQKILHGHIIYQTFLKTKNVKQILLDTRYLKIHRVFINNTIVIHRMGSFHTAFGTVLIIELPMDVPNAFELRIDYETTPKSTAIQWLPPEQTADKVYPYLLTQCQAIHARSMIPCQDSPSAKFKYTASITAPSWSNCLMSALSVSADHESIEDDGNLSTFGFKQDIPIPSYLLAMVVGSLESRQISSRCSIWSEPSVVDKALYEFNQTEEFLQYAEEITGIPYQWKRYDLICLPPSFPFGGMENPCLTFVTPTLLAGDQSLADVVAHEIAHSWTGNLVTNETWEDFWLNEGWTMWLQRKIMERIHHDPKYFDFDAGIGWKSLLNDIENFKDIPNFTRLVPTLNDIDPDDCFSTIPYEKGFAFLYYLTQCIGGHEAFLKFAQTYLKDFQSQTINSNQFRDYFLQYCQEHKIKIPSIEWEKWYTTPGLPLIQPSYDTTLRDPALQVAKNWLEGGEKCSEKDVVQWSTSHYLILLDYLLEIQEKDSASFSFPLIKRMDQMYTLSKSHNAEIRFRWYTLALRLCYDDIIPYVSKFITEQGRTSYIRPLYRELMNYPNKKEWTIAFFKKYHKNYHPIAQSMIAKDLNINIDEENSIEENLNIKTNSLTTNLDHPIKENRYSSTLLNCSGFIFIVSFVVAAYIQHKRTS